MASQPEFVLVGVLMKQHLSSAQTNDSFSLFENHSSGPSKTPIHVHAKDDETLFMMQGEMRAIISGKEQTIRAGESIFLPRGIPHQLMNESGLPAHYLLLCTPGGFEGFLVDCGHALTEGEIPGPPSAADIDRLKAAAPQYGITLFPDWAAARDYEEV
ncbi:cupin domain-containing protein [Tunturiibacter lichenicola]|uniref:cupin domain-containing protein n=1 Tax=Tunturiibacter lichenicola TaxID=2051959 RepID=UPI0021B2E3FB|nr:cupin domain-containing protein [Edaphobacter lichenicola]